MRQLLFILICFTLGISCSEDHDCEEGVIEVPNSIAVLPGDEYNESLLDCRTPRVQTFTFQGFLGGTFIGSQGTQITIPVQSIVDAEGNPVDQNVTLELIEMYNPGDIIACQLSTDGLSTTRVPEPLLSEGMYYINLVVPGIDIALINPISVFGPSDNVNLTLNQFNSLSCQELQCIVLWEFNTTTEVIPDTIEGPTGETISGYRTFVSELGWSSIARYNPDESSRTIVYNKTTTAFNGTNSNTFLVYQNSSVGISLFETYDNNLEVFSEVHGQIPTDTQASFVLVTVQDGQYRYATSSTMITPDKIGTTLQTSDASEENFISQINTLQ